MLLMGNVWDCDCEPLGDTNIYITHFEVYWEWSVVVVYSLFKTLAIKSKDKVLGSREFEVWGIVKIMI